MNVPALTLGWELWGKHRLGLCLVALYLFVLSLAFQVMPPAWCNTFTAGGSVLPMSIVLTYLGALFSYGWSGDLLAHESGFPARLFTLPVPTGLLIAWPLGTAFVACLVVWLDLAAFVLRPSGLAVPLVWPAFLCAALVAWVQALVWWPLGLPMLRLALLIGILTPIHFVPAVGLIFGASEAQVSGALAGVVFLGWGAAYLGVVRARRGDNPAWYLLVRRLGRLLPQRSHPFASAQQARVWLDWRQNGLLLLLYSPFWLLIILACLPPIEELLKEVALLGWIPEIAALSQETVSELILLCAFMQPVFVAFTLGLSVSNRTLGRPRWDLPDFLAAQPLSTVDMVRAKLWMAACVTGGLWAITSVVLPLWLLLSGYHKALALAAERLLQQYSAWQASLLVALAVAGLVLLTWRELIVNLYLPLTGRAWIVNSVSMAYILSFLALCAAGHWLFSYPDWLNLLGQFLPWALGFLVLLKLVIAGWGLNALHRRQFLTIRAILYLLGAWVVVVVSLAALLGWLVPVALVYIVLGVLLVVPLARLTLAPLALAWNRHR